VVLLKGLAVWVIILLIEFAHGVARGVLLEPYIGDFRAHQIIVFTGSAITIAIAIVFVRWIRARSEMEWFFWGSETKHSLPVD
jgi:hypothetical protein